MAYPRRKMEDEDECEDGNRVVLMVVAIMVRCLVGDGFLLERAWLFYWVWRDGCLLGSCVCSKSYRICDNTPLVMHYLARMD